MKKALLLVDIQNDFLPPDGALAVKGGDSIIPLVNALQPQFSHIFATKDWHPRNHISFASRHGKKIGEVLEIHGLIQELWPDHCVQETKGSEFPDSLDLQKIEKVFYKGEDPEVDSYSAFYDNARVHSTGLHEYLSKKGIEHLYIAGLATDFCVRYSVHDALALGYSVSVIVDACRGVGLRPHVIEDVLEEMSQRGAKLITSSSLLIN